LETTIAKKKKMGHAPLSMMEREKSDGKNWSGEAT
jgi:hypothetical protein